MRFLLADGARAYGSLQRAVSRAGVRGTVEPERD